MFMHITVLAYPQEPSFFAPCTLPSFTWYPPEDLSKSIWVHMFVHCICFKNHQSWHTYTNCSSVKSCIHNIHYWQALGNGIIDIIWFDSHGELWHACLRVYSTEYITLVYFVCCTCITQLSFSCCIHMCMHKDKFLFWYLRLATG